MWTIGPLHIYSKIVVSFVVVMIVNKCFFFLRILPQLTPIVVMLTNVVYDLRIFLLFYTILIVLFAQFFAILGVGNIKVPGRFRDQWTAPDIGYSGRPGYEYD